MTVSTISNKVTYAGNGSSTVFAFNFAVPFGTVAQVAAELLVTVVNASGVSSVVAFGPATSQYQLTVNSPVGPDPTPVGGVVTYNPSGAPVPTGSFLTIQRVLPLTQGTSLANQGTFYPATVEQALDYQMMVIQQNILANAIVAPATDPVGLNYTLPTATQRANQTLIFDSSGNVSSGSVATGAIVSAPMVPVVGAASLPAARTALGLGTMATENIGTAGALQDDGAGNARVNFSVTTAAASRAIVLGDYLDKLKITGPITLTLPRANTTFNGFGFWFENLIPGGTLIIAVNPADSIENLGSGVSVTIPIGVGGFITTNAAAGGTWYLELNPGATVNATPPVVASKFTALVTNGVVGNNAVTVSAAYVVVSDGTNFYTITPTGGINFGVAGVGGLDTGSITAATWYYIWAIHNPTTRVSNWIVSASNTLPSLPAGYSAYGLYGVLRTAAAIAALMGTSQFGDRVEYIPGVGQTLTIPVAITGNSGNVATPTWTSVSLAALVPPIAKTYDVILQLAQSPGPGTSSMAAPSSAYGGVNSTTNPPPMSLSGMQTTGAGINISNAFSQLGTFGGAGPLFYASNGGGGAWIMAFELNL